MNEVKPNISIFLNNIKSIIPEAKLLDIFLDFLKLNHQNDFEKLNQKILIQIDVIKKKINKNLDSKSVYYFIINDLKLLNDAILKYQKILLKNKNNFTFKKNLKYTEKNNKIFFFSKKIEEIYTKININSLNFKKKLNYFSNYINEPKNIILHNKKKSKSLISNEISNEEYLKKIKKFYKINYFLQQTSKIYLNNFRKFLKLFLFFLAPNIIGLIFSTILLMII